MVTAAPPPGTGSGPFGVPGGTDRSYQVDIIVCAIITAFIGTVFVVLRFYTRTVIIPVLGWADRLILASQIFSIAMTVTFVQAATLGLGSHVRLISPENLRHLTMISWYTFLFYKLSLWMSQVSILLLYIPIWTFPWVRRTTFALLVLIMVYNIFVVIAVFTACIPLRAFWDFTIQNAYCHALGLWWTIGALHIVTDFMIYLLPLSVIVQLRFPRRKKILLLVLFTFGFFVCFMSIARVIMFKFTVETRDYTFHNVTIAFWSCVETNATIVIACFMTMKPLLAKWFPIFTGFRSQNLDGGHHSEATDDVSSRPPTIGSKPSRSSTHPRHPARVMTCPGPSSPTAFEMDSPTVSLPQGLQSNIDPRGHAGFEGRDAS